MKNLTRIPMIVLSLMFARPAFALTPEMNLYLRAGAGANGHGGAQECINNSGAWGNEFRLGNECGIYGEFGFGASILKGETEEAPHWRFFSNFAVVYDNRKDWEAPNTNNWVLREVYTEGGNFDGLHFHAWAGKRFYRWGDVHIMDFYPVSMSGPGGGIGGLRSDAGTWSAAIIQNGESSEINGTGGVTTKAGTAAKTTLHVRLENTPSPLGNWSTWLAAGKTPATSSAAGTQDYKSGSGLFLAVKNSAGLGDGVWNEFGLAAGTGVMSNMGPNGELVKDCDLETDSSCTVAKSNRLRAWESLTADVGRWSGQLAIIHDQLNKGTTEDARVTWSSIGVRPVYAFTDHLSLAFEAGISEVRDESDGLGSRNLSRYTVAPQMSLGKGFYSRPVLRAFYTRSEWNKNNAVSAAGKSFAGKTSADSIGVQTEIWF